METITERSPLNCDKECRPGHQAGSGESRPAGGRRRTASSPRPARAPTPPLPAPPRHADVPREEPSAGARENFEPAQQAALIRNALFASLMTSGIGLDNLFSSSGFRLFLAQLVRDAGGPTDPIEVMLIEQLAMLHFRSADLHSRAGQAPAVESAAAYTAAAARLTSEFRRGALALAAYRSSACAGKAQEPAPQGPAGAGVATPPGR
jgi:hypothetical protein